MNTPDTEKFEGYCECGDNTQDDTSTIKHKSYCSKSHTQSTPDTEEKIDEVCTNPLHDIKHPELGGLSYHEYEQKLNKTMNTIVTPDTEGAIDVQKYHLGLAFKSILASENPEEAFVQYFSSRDTYWKERVRKMFAELMELEKNRPEGAMIDFKAIAKAHGITNEDNLK